MIVDLTLTAFERGVRERERWIKFFNRPLPDLDFIPDLAEKLAGASYAHERFSHWRCRAEFQGCPLCGGKNIDEGQPCCNSCAYGAHNDS